MVLFHHYAIETDRLKEVENFYKNILGFQLEETMDFRGKKLIFMTLGGFRLELVESIMRGGGEGSVHLCFETGSLDNLIKKLEKAGLEKVEGPYTLENGWKTVFYTGLGGETLEFLEQR
ncbi:glyoxalase/bleomycin resistance/dioxygenase family protein [Neobacillus piezotolerans]|uniref:Glyoxalase/bleomycin resistance/dioxygenase family protein n=1 Tax=Neobacillus piezotolerans TaxID=2259171 RepID=A0A3D8GMW9_9BACI|nr:VOC family protein [Neobacillus piezotolerans]RDU35758.1 glyoxalase/bleomycin resistance/dioxygenase family protein [Neobacillus piezotolerans]